MDKCEWANANKHYDEDNGFFPEWNSVTRLSVIVVAIVFVGIVSLYCHTFTISATAAAAAAATTATAAAAVSLPVQFIKKNSPPPSSCVQCSFVHIHFKFACVHVIRHFTIHTMYYGYGAFDS